MPSLHHPLLPLVECGHPKKTTMKEDATFSFSLFGNVFIIA